MPVMDLPALLSVARGDTPADLLLRDARIVNVFTGEIERGDIAIVGDRIAGIGSGYTANTEMDLSGAYVAPGLIDAHVHIESSLCVPANFAAAVLPRGVTTVITDPHEIANVAGIAGVQFMADARAGVPLRIEIMAPSCVPATDMGTAGAVLNAADLAALLASGQVRGLAEVMNFPAVIAGDRAMLAKLAAFAGHPVDGHCPAVTGRALNAYAAAGIHSDHESVSVEEAKQKLARGLYVLMREATNARNLSTLLPLMTPANNRRICFCTDDRTPADLLGDETDQGSVDAMVRTAIAAGVDPIDAFRAATLNTAEAFGLHDRGAIAPGRLADLMIFNNLKAPTARRVLVGGQSVRNYRGGPTTLPAPVVHTCRVDLAQLDLRIPLRGPRVRVIGALPDQLITEHRLMAPTCAGELAVADAWRDLLKMAVIERHGCSGRVGLGFVQGFGLKRGAIAGSVAHDHHNLVIIGADDDSMRTAARAAAEGGGGLAAAEGSTVLARLALPVAGLMSDQPVELVRETYARLLAAGSGVLGASFADPFMAMSFMALEVIPSLKLTDQGLVDVEKFERVDLFTAD
jgi:adenine deaminase